MVLIKQRFFHTEVPGFQSLQFGATGDFLYFCINSNIPLKNVVLFYPVFPSIFYLEGFSGDVVCYSDRNGRPIL